MGEIIRFTDERFIRLYKSPAESEYNNRRARLIYKACEVYHYIKEKKENANNDKKKKMKFLHRLQI